MESHASPASSPDPQNQSTPLWPEVDDVPGDTLLYCEPEGNWYTALKPTFETIIASILMLPALPFIGLAWLAIKISSQGPGFYIQTRLGQNGKPYRIIKIRSMKHCPTVASNINWAKLSGDERITTVGKILRALHLDELPQLFNVICGEMSLIGPRPERPEVIKEKQLATHVPGYDLRMIVKPGVTGLAQVQLPADTDVISVRHKLYYDLYHLVNQSPWLDFRICLATLLKAVLGPETLRRVLFLPTREQVCEQFLALCTPPATISDSDKNPAPVV
jgi:lipopolysaccharide/colanic/teichoic acid biosynthesis glycosyltransferase